MQSDWLAASSLERTHKIISAINTLSIHAKLVLAHIEDPADEAEVQQARAHLLQFLNQFQLLLRDAEQSQDGTVVGSDPRLGELALQYLSQKQRRPQRSPLYNISVATLSDLVNSERPEDLSTLVPCLHDLRSLVEQHSHADVVGILGDL